MAYTHQAAQSKFMQPTMATQVKGRREMMAGTLGLAAAAAERKALAEETRKKDGRGALLLVAPATALGWVGFNILGPALNQLDTMQDRADSLSGGGKKKR